MTLLEGGKAHPSFLTPTLVPVTLHHTPFHKLSVTPSIVWSTLGRGVPPAYKTWVETGAQDGKPVFKVL